MLPPALADGQTYGAGNKFSDSIFFTCDPGYVLSGLSSLTCLASGEWNSAVPACKPVKCQQLVSPKHASLNTSMHIFKTIVQLECDVGYKLVGDISHTECTATGLWSKRLPDCEIVACPATVAPHDVKVIEEGKYFGSQLVWKCQAGFRRLAGDEVRYCDVNGKWRGEQLICQGMLMSFLCK